MKLCTQLYSAAFVLFLTSCFPKENKVVQEIKPNTVIENVMIGKPASETSKVVAYLTKEQREAIYFAASLEREALKLITKNNFYDKGTLFSVLSYIVESDAGNKKMFPANMDCSRFRIEKKNAELFIYKTCQKPETLVLKIKQQLDGAELQVEFIASEWPSVLGTSVALTNSDITCQLLIREKRLQSMNCQSWSYLVSENNLSATEIKLKIFAFERKNSLQFQLKGGFFKDLVENKKIAIMIPIEGQIKVIGKEIEVIDDFAEKPKVELKDEPKKLKPFIIGGPDGQKENSQEIRNREEASKESAKEKREKNDEEGRAHYQNESREEIERKQNEQKAAEQKIHDEEIRQSIQSDETNGGVPKSDGVPETKNRSR